MPAGLIDEGEGAAQAAVRELKEETGMSVAIRSCAQFVVCCWQRAFSSNGRHCVQAAVQGCYCSQFCGLWQDILEQSQLYQSLVSATPA